MLPQWLTKHLFTYDPANVSANVLETMAAKLSRFRVNNPEISIVIPAYNEEANLLHTLSSLAEQQVSAPTELIVVNNNSTDRTQALLDACGVKSVLERKAGVAHARQAGLEVARGRFLANADSDCIYPAGWVNAITNPLRRPDISCAYGLYSFLPSPGSSRPVLMGYEKAAHLVNWIRNRNKAYLNVYGFNFAFRREDALSVGGYLLDSGREGSVAELIAAGIKPGDSGRCEDGWMALSLLEQGKGNILRVTSADARVWTSDRRLMADGGLGKAFANRVLKTVRELGRYSSPTPDSTLP